MGEENHSLGIHLDARDNFVLARCHGPGEPRMGLPRHAYVRPLPWFGFAPSDLIPMKSVTMVMEPTGLDEDCQSFRVRNSPRNSTNSYSLTVAKFYYS